MIWRILVLMSWTYVFAYVDKHYGREAAWCLSSAIMVILLPLSEIERRLATLAQAQCDRTVSKEARK
jgi:hypothetical protein